MNEMPLVVFTVLSQLAVGAFITLWILNIAKNKISLRTGKMISGSLVIITALSLGASLFHLGDPFNAYRALTHFSTSWLSREVAFFSLFLLAGAIYFLQWKEGKEKNRNIIGAVASVIGFISVISTGMIYVLPAMPAWNNFSPVVFFLLTAALLGPIYVGTLIMIIEKKQLLNIPVIIVVVIGIYLVSFTVYLSVLFSGDTALYLTGANIINSSAFWFRIVLSWIIPLLMFVTVLFRKQNYGLNYLVVAFLSIIVGEILGRELFYSTIVGLQVNGLF